MFSPCSGEDSSCMGLLGEVWKKMQSDREAAAVDKADVWCDTSVHEAHGPRLPSMPTVPLCDDEFE